MAFSLAIGGLPPCSPLSACTPGLRSWRLSVSDLLYSDALRTLDRYLLQASAGQMLTPCTTAACM